MKMVVPNIFLLKKVWFDGESSYAKDIGKFIFGVMFLLLVFEYFEHEFRMQSVHREHEKDRLLVLANRNMNLAGSIVEESIWLVNSRDDSEMNSHKEKIKKLLSMLNVAHHELLLHSGHLGVIKAKENPINYLDRYYQELNKNIKALLSLKRSVLESLGNDPYSLREVLSEGPDSGDDSEAFSLDLEKLATLFHEANREKASLHSRMEFYLGLFKLTGWLLMAGAVYYAVRKGYRRDIEFQGTHRALKIERDKLSKHHKEDQLNIETAKLLFSLINGPVPRYTSIPEDLLLFTESIINSCHKEGGDHSGVIKTGDYIYFYNADEAGHEVSTVLWSIVSRLMLKRSIINEHGAPHGDPEGRVSGIMNTLNKVLNLAYPEVHFCTMVLGRIDVKTLEMHYSRAAHPEFYVIRGDQVHSLPASDKDYNGDPFLGILEDIRYQEGRFQLTPGDKLILLTDGFSEAARKKTDGKQEAYGFDRIKNTLSRNSHLPVRLIFDHLCADVQQFTEKRLGFRVNKERAGPREYRVTCENELEDDASALLLQIDHLYDFQTVFELEPKNLGDLTNRVSEIWSEQLSHIMKREGFSSGSLFGAQMAFDEAVVNAFKHGHAGALQTIKIGVSVKNDLIIHIFDQGQGFEESALPDPTSGDNLQRPSGRGFYLIKEYCSECSWFKVKFEKYTFCLQLIFRRYPDLGDKQNAERMRIMSLLQENGNI